MQNEVSNITQLPYFIIFKIANYLRDTESYNNFRLTSKKILECIPYARSFYESGALYSSIKIYHSIPQSNKEIFFQNGNLRMSFSLRGFKHHGPFNEFYETGHKKKTGCFYLNKKDGPFTEYFINGLLSLSENYYRGKRNGPTFEYYENGAPRYEVHYKDGIRNGIYREFLNNGELIVEKTYKNGKIHGLYREWSGGILTILGSYIYGKLENKWDEYYVDGGLRLRRNYLDGKQHGNEISYYVNGKIKTIKRFVLGKQEGIEKEYNRNGYIKYIERWKNGFKHGLATYYTINENTTKTVEYFYNTIMYSCIVNKTQKNKKVEELFVPIGRVKIQTSNNINSICVYTGDYNYEYETIYDNNNEYIRFYFNQLKSPTEHIQLELITFIDNTNSYKSRTMVLNDKLKIRKSNNILYYIIEPPSSE